MFGMLVLQHYHEYNPLWISYVNLYHLLAIMNSCHHIVYIAVIHIYMRVAQSNHLTAWIMLTFSHNTTTQWSSRTFHDIQDELQYDTEEQQSYTEEYLDE